MSKLFDVVFPEAEYTDPSTGQQKTRWKNCGAVIRNDATGKTALKLDSLPVNPKPNQDGQGGLWFQLMTPQPRTQAAPQAAAMAPATDAFPEEKEPIPF